MIDEDQSDCDYTKIEYDLTLVTNITTEIETQLETQLNTQLEMELGVLLKDFLSNIFFVFSPQWLGPKAGRQPGQLYAEPADA